MSIVFIFAATVVLVIFRSCVLMACKRMKCRRKAKSAAKAANLIEAGIDLLAVARMVYLSLKHSGVFLIILGLSTGLLFHLYSLRRRINVTDPCKLAETPLNQRLRFSDLVVDVLPPGYRAEALGHYFESGEYAEWVEKHGEKTADRMYKVRVAMIVLDFLFKDLWTAVKKRIAGGS